MNIIRKIPATKQDVEAAVEKAVDRMADMIGKGFAHNDTRLDAIESRLDHLDARVGRIEADMHELRGEIVYRHEFDDVLDRIKYLEKKLGAESGV